MTDYNFIDGTEANGFRDLVEIRTGYYTCVVDLPSYINGAKSFPCMVGKNRKLTTRDCGMIDAMLNFNHMGRLATLKKREHLEILNKKHGGEFYEWKDRLDWLCSEVGITRNSEFVAMYPKLDLSRECVITYIDKGENITNKKVNWGYGYNTHSLF